MAETPVVNERLCNAIVSSGYTRQYVADAVNVDPKTIERWVTLSRVPHRKTAIKVARLLGVSISWLWPKLEKVQNSFSRTELMAFYPHRFEVPNALWLEVLEEARKDIGILAYASLFLPENNPAVIRILRKKAEQGIRVRIILGDPDSAEVAMRGVEERLFDALTGRIRMALAYYRPLLGAPGVEFHLHRTALYNSIFRYDDQILINNHVYGTYGYLAPIIHVRRIEGGTLFDMYAQSFERVWEASYPWEPPP